MKRQRKKNIQNDYSQIKVDKKDAKLLIQYSTTQNGYKLNKLVSKKIKNGILKNIKHPIKLLDDNIKLKKYPNVIFINKFLIKKITIIKQLYKSTIKQSVKICFLLKNINYVKN
jgi:hypothetical protein|uniref:Orf113 n=1 Tax=Ochromonas danica TaxID=2986 RepID=Q9G913_OCHDN|nr:orf113 [Ochromonas danica]AAG18392.1 orf113 [Ochromonas danica]